MQTTSALYKQILADPQHVKEWRAQIGDLTFDKTNTVSIRRSSALYGKQLIGGACSGSLELVLLPSTVHWWKKSGIGYVEFLESGEEIYIYPEEEITLYRHIKVAEYSEEFGGVVEGVDGVTVSGEQLLTYYTQGYIYTGEPNFILEIKSATWDDEEEAYVCGTLPEIYADISPFSGAVLCEGIDDGEVSASSEDAYPQYGQQDGAWYRYDGERSVTIPTMARVELSVRAVAQTLIAAPYGSMVTEGFMEDYEHERFFIRSRSAIMLNGTAILYDPEEVSTWEFSDLEELWRGFYWQRPGYDAVFYTPENAEITYDWVSGHRFYSIPCYAEFEPQPDTEEETVASESLPMGTYWIDRRKEDQESGELTLTCVDGMMFGEQDFYPPGSEITDWTDKTMREVAQMCATKMGIDLEDATQFQNAAPYLLTAPPVGYTVRQVLQGIAAAHGGNIVVTANNELRLVPFAPTDTGFDLEQNVSELDTGKQYEAFGNVVFTFDSADGEEVIVRYPTTESSGATIEAPLQTVTDSNYARTIAQNVLTALGSYRYAPYKAADALLDPAMELGDGVTINGLYSVIAAADDICDELYSASIGAESYEETKSEFIFKPSAERTIERKIAQSSASLRVDIDGIKAMVSGLAAPWEAGHSYSVGDIAEYESKFYRCIVANNDDEFDPDKWTEIDSGVVESILQLAIGKMTLSVSGDGSGSSIVLTSGSVRITSAATFFETNEAHFSGSLSANKISAGSIDADVVSVKDAFAVQMLVNNVWTTVGYVGAATGIDASGNTTRGAVLKSVDGDSYVIATNAGVRMQQGDTGLWIADDAISYRINGGDVTPLGYAVFS